MATKQHDWTQDANNVYINIPISGVSLKKIDVYISDLVLKVNVKANNFLKVFDLPHEVDYKSRENKVTYNDGVLEVAIKKVESQMWDNLTASGLSKEEIRTRREESLKRREEEEKQLQSQRDTLKTQFDRLATEQQMKLESMERDTIEERKRLEREQAENEIYSQLDADSRFKTTQQEERREAPSKAKAIQQEEDIVEEKAATKKPTTAAKNGDIFEADSVPYSNEAEEPVRAPVEEPVKKEEPKPVALPEPRKAGSVQVKFTEKMYPHMAAREQHLKEPPFPKTTQIKKGEKDEETENPIWLKEKADEFFKNQDYLSAINAYSSALRKNNEMLECIANRTLCYLNLFDYENCIQDCNLLLESLAKQTEETQKSKKLKLKTNIRKGIALSWKGSLDEAKGVFEEQLKYIQDENQDPTDKKTLEEYIQLVETRINLNNIKQRGDLALGKANVEEAKKVYESILEQDPNHEIVKANLSLTLLKLNDHQQAVKQCDEVLNILQSFKSTTQIDLGQGRSWNEFKTFVVKILLRRGTALENLERYPEALKDVEQALLFQAENAQAKKAQYRLRAQVARKEVESIKEEANALLKEKKVELALQKYDECLKKIQPTDLVPYLGILLNKCTCHLFKNEYEEITSICIRGLRLISNHKQKVISFADKSEKKELNDKLKDYEIRFLVRRGNAYLKTKKFYHAKSDLEEALKLDPQNAQIKQDLQALNEAIAEK